MIFLKVKLDNIFMFKGAELDLTYPKKLPKSTIEFEYLEDFPKIKYKRVCILTGANASGKTVFGKALCIINNYLVGRDIDQNSNLFNLKKMMFNKKQKASFQVEFITLNDNKCHLLKATFDDYGLLEESYKSVPLLKSDNQKMLSDRLLNSEEISFYNRDDNNHGITNPGFSSYACSIKELEPIPSWNYRFCEAGNSNGIIPKTINAKTIKTFLTAFDSSIIGVDKIESESYKIKFSNGEYVLVDKGEIVNSNRLSRGTNEAIEIASFYEQMKCNENAKEAITHYLDEKLAYSHTEIEKSIISLLIDILPRKSQFFYTTHNYDVLDMNLPIHSYVFLKKDKYSEFIHPEKLGYNKNDRSLLGLIKNDVFGSLPNTEKIDNLK